MCVSKGVIKELFEYVILELIRLQCFLKLVHWLGRVAGWLRAQKMNACTEATRSIYCEMFDTRGISFDLAKAVCVQYLEKKMNYFRILLLETQEASLKGSPRSAVPVVHECQAFRAAAASADDPNADADDCDLNSAFGLDDVGRIGAKCHLGDFRNSFRVKKRETQDSSDHY